MKRKSVFLFFVSILLSGCLDVTPSYIESRGENPVITDVSDCSIEKPQEATSPKIKNSLNIYNSRWDNFSGHLEKGQIYYCDNGISHRALRFRVLQVLSEDEVLVTRNSAREDFEDVCEHAIFYVLGKTNYADNAILKDGEYICLGTYQYENKNNDLKTVYALIEKDYLEEYAEKIKQEK